LYLKLNKHIIWVPKNKDLKDEGTNIYTYSYQDFVHVEPNDKIKALTLFFIKKDDD